MVEVMSKASSSPAMRRRKTLTEEFREGVVSRAGEFICQRYRLDATAAERLKALPVRWRRGCGRSAFYRRACRGYDGPHILLRVPSGISAGWHTYRRVRARLSTPRGGIEMPIDVLMTVVLIHEYTHAVQHGVCGHAPRKYSEVETTENEIEFVRLHAPDAFARLVGVMSPKNARARTSLRRAANKWSGIVEPRPPASRPSGARALALRILRSILVRYQIAKHK